ncbi:A/G-specific adenine glycosylase [Corynebacterium cystitidis]|uniref:Adenine DNA glycosylase n=1 Tax=Corynebacterium cystitidis DSM 20524 TaxID=1121357 RepID=A0A1H9W7X6_9CORY|nr:A/G-specific adenine glycosylase [Corynebacterium cystitidis]WJY83287.1 A/G-specific adenine glycosylase [Corynebacterium cystitidis DSM 20524]SES29998.1 A/G-specific DNA-adenine glycosylase [Corynebacterium cystitidis DSM 20524]SNV63847.1 A/G-specific adenine glycosylase [Corynebacterium cystitidis]
MSTNATNFPRATIIAWFQENARDLPWRSPSTTAWAILLSEVMSQQTPVARVAPIWQQWVERWPDPATFAAAQPAEVLRAWGSLGYPRRALRLLECAQVIVDKHDGQVPDDVDELLSLPGIGQYTARAVACFAFGQNVPVVDTNVRRVYARMVDGRPLAPPASKRELSEVAALLPDDHGPTFSAGLMELGALICTATAPRCGECPVPSHCHWLQAGKPAPTEDELRKKKVQKFAGTDRQVRGLIMKVLREADGPVPRASIDIVWPDDAQRDRALFSLIDDGLAEQDNAGLFHLPRA